MNDASKSLPEMLKLLEQRLTLVGALAESLEASRWAIGRKDLEAIARGAAHQAELCRQWNQLEQRLRMELLSGRLCPVDRHSPQMKKSAELSAQWEALSSRIRYLTRVHWSLLRHMQRSLSVLNGIVNRMAPTYSVTVAEPPSQTTLTAGD